MSRIPAVSSLSTDITQTPIGRLVRDVDMRHDARIRVRSLASWMLTADPFMAGLDPARFRVAYRIALLAATDIVVDAFIFARS
jgi:hypothetical protein